MARPTMVYKTEKVTAPDDKATGACIRNYRKWAGLSLRELAKIIGKSAPYLSDLERGRRGWNERLFEEVMLAIEKIK